MKRMWTKVAAAVLLVAVLAAVIAIMVTNRTIVKAPTGTAPLDNKLDTDSVAHLIVDEAGVLSEKAERIILIYNANWVALENRVMAVVTVKNTENAKNAEEDAWKWVRRLSLSENDALLLIEAQGPKKCVLVSGGTFREDIDTLHNAFLEGLTYMNLRAGEFDAAVLAVFERLHYLYGYDAELHHKTFVREGLITFAIIAALMLPILIHMIAEKIDSRQFMRWYNTYGVSDSPAVPWKTVFPWHRTGSRWYKLRVSGEWFDYRLAIRNTRREAGMRARMNGGRFR